MTVLSDARSSVRAAQKAGRLGAEDKAAIKALYVLAGRIDRGHADRDNTVMPTFLKYCESLGLTPAGRRSLGKPKKDAEGGGKLGQLRAVPKPASSA